uniref:Uncharacterized protein n=1 Tax=Triticum urartu TaxID=4572 RepID=A0A8R7PQ64_TRIUA
MKNAYFLYFLMQFELHVSLRKVVHTLILLSCALYYICMFFSFLEGIYSNLSSTTEVKYLINHSSKNMSSTNKVCLFMFVPDKGREATKATKGEPRDAELPCDVTGPPVYHVRYDAARRQALLLKEVRHERLLQRGTGLHEVQEQIL